MDKKETSVKDGEIKRDKQAKRGQGEEESRLLALKN